MNLFVQPPTALTASGTSGPINVPQSIKSLLVDVNVTAVAGTTPTLDVYIEGQDENNVWFVLWHPTQITAVTNPPLDQAMGPGLQQAIVVPDTIRVRWVVGGTAGPSFTTSISVIGE